MRELCQTKTPHATFVAARGTSRRINNDDMFVPTRVVTSSSLRIQPQPTDHMKPNRTFLFLLAAALLLPLCAFAADAPQSGDFATGATLKVTWVQTLIVILVPALIAALKLVVPRVPGIVILTLCPVLGLVADWLMKAAGLDIGNAEASAALGSVGVYVREVIDQAKKTTNGGRLSVLAFAVFTLSAGSASAAAPAVAHARGFYADQFMTLRTADFSAADYGYGIGLGYQVSEHWGADMRVAHDGLNVDGHTVTEIGGRLVARMPFKTLSPYTFLGAAFDLESDQWRIRPGAGVEYKITRTLAAFAEGGLDADLRGRNGYSFASGLRWRF